MSNRVRDKLKDIFETTVESGIIYEGATDKPEYYNLFCKAAAHDQLYQIKGNNLCMFNCQKNNADAVMMLFSIPINSSEEAGAKNVAEKVMEIVESAEDCFTTLDDIRTEPVHEDKFIYITMIKSVN